MTDRLETVAQPRRASSISAALSRAVMAAMLCVGSGALAEPQIGSRLGNRTEQFNSRTSQDAVWSGHEFANCIYLRRQSAARGFLDARTMAAASAIQANLAREVLCQNLTRLSHYADGQMLHQPLDLYRGMIAEAAILPMDVSKLAPMPIQQSYPRDWFVVTGRDPSVDEMAVCVAEVNPLGIRAVLTTTAQTADESAAIGKLGPALGVCLRTGATLKSNRQSLRAALAEALYHRAVDPVVVIAAK